MRSSRRVAGAGALLAALATTCAAASSAPPAPTQCKPDEKVYFSCQAGRKIVSLCGRMDGAHLGALAYRYGFPGKVENEFVATSSSADHFLGTTSPAGPNAQVKQVWFNRSDIQYLLTECVGGDCPYESGLAVLKGDDVVSTSRCASHTDPHAFFSHDLVDFHLDGKPSVSKTPLLELGDYGNPVEKIYKIGGGAR